MAIQWKPSVALIAEKCSPFLPNIGLLFFTGPFVCEKITKGTGILKEQCPSVLTQNVYKWRKCSLNLWENDF